MASTEHLGDAAVLALLGERLARYRLERNLTQSDLAREAGVSKRTLVRLEGGESTQLTNLIRVLRALGLLVNLDALVPPPTPSPLEQLRTRERLRKRASSRADDGPSSRSAAPARSAPPPGGAPPARSSPPSRSAPPARSTPPSGSAQPSRKAPSSKPKWTWGEDERDR